MCPKGSKIKFCNSQKIYFLGKQAAFRMLQCMYDNCQVYRSHFLVFMNTCLLVFGDRSPEPQLVTGQPRHLPPSCLSRLVFTIIINTKYLYRKRTQPWTDFLSHKFWHCLSHKFFTDIASVIRFFWLRLCLLEAQISKTKQVPFLYGSRGAWVFIDLSQQRLIFN